MPALVSYITRAESPLNTSLGHALFKDNIHSVVLLQKFKKATQQVLNSAGLAVDRVSNCVFVLSCVQLITVMNSLKLCKLYVKSSASSPVYNSQTTNNHTTTLFSTAP